MPTDRQIEAKRSNARKSTRPRSRAKSRVAANALEHSLVGRHIVIPSEDADDYNDFRARIVNSLEPEGALERLLAHKVVDDAWRLRRIPILEAAVHRRSRGERPIRKVPAVVEVPGSVENAPAPASITRKPLRTDCRVDAERTLQQVRNDKANLSMGDAVFEASRVLETSVVVFSNLWRHERALTHTLHRTLRELQRLQAIRREEHVPAPCATDLRLHVDPARSGAPCNSIDRGFNAAVVVAENHSTLPA